MIQSDGSRRSNRWKAALTAVLGIGGGLFIALFMFIQLRAAWDTGVVAIGQGGEDAWDLAYETEPLRYILAMSTFFPVAIICGIGLALASALVAARDWNASRRPSKTIEQR